MKRSLISLLHIGFWLGYLLCLIFIMFVISQWEDVQPEDYNYYAAFFAGVAIVPAVFAFYTQYHFLFPRFLQKRQWTKATIYGIGLALAATLAGNLTIALADEEALNCLLTCFPYGPLFTFGVALVFSIIGLVLRGFLTWIEELKLKEELVEKNHKMELALVKAQLDPHFLFNTINNIDVLITKDPEEASRYLNQLSDMMRFMLYETKSEHIPLEQELSYIDKYVELQRIRTANENYVQYEVEGQPGGKQVAPMIFIPFIENAFK
ncbi:MAG: histidine kinase, partial [Bacteroidota bacterium]